MKHYKGEIVNVYDGDFIGWTTAKLLELLDKCNGYERWRMVTKEGYELIRLVDFDKKYIKNKEGYYDGNKTDVRGICTQ